jgi:hypothetical protein
MPHFVYTGLVPGQREKQIELLKKRFSNRYFPHPIWGGFPEKEDGNPNQWYITKNDPPQIVAAKTKAQDEYVAERVAELEEDLDKRDASMRLADIEFVKDVPTFVPDNHQLMMDKDVGNGKVRRAKLLCMCAGRTAQFKLVESEVVSDEPPALTAMTKVQLIEMAKSDFDLDLPPEMKKAEMIEAIEAAQG